MKILISERQVNLLAEGGSSRIMSLRDLAEMVSRIGHGVYEEFDVNVFHQVFIAAYKRHGDDGVMALFEAATKRKIEPISRAKYILSNN
jgi:hypothetical protein